MKDVNQLGLKFTEGKTHLERVGNHLLNFGIITNWEAAYEYGNFRLSEYIRILRSDGWKIETVWKEKKNRYGTPIRYGVYTIDVEQRMEKIQANEK